MPRSSANRHPMHNPFDGRAPRRIYRPSIYELSCDVSALPMAPPRGAGAREFGVAKPYLLLLVGVPRRRAEQGYAMMQDMGGGDRSPDGRRHPVRQHRPARGAGSHRADGPDRPTTGPRLTAVGATTLAEQLTACRPWPRVFASWARPAISRCWSRLAPSQRGSERSSRNVHSARSTWQTLLLGALDARLRQGRGADLTPERRLSMSLASAVSPR